MPAHPWELRADVRPLEVAAQRWTEIATLMTRRGDELVDAARRATEGWDAAAAESYDNHRRQVLVNLDRFTNLASQISGSLRAISAIVMSSQKELDQAWANVAMVPHDLVGESRHLVFRPEADEDRGKVTRGQAETDEIRRRLALSLDEESARLRAARAEFVMLSTELKTLAGATFARGLAPGEDASGVGTVVPASTSVLGSAQSGVSGVSGVSGLPPIAPISVSMPDLTGISPAALAPFAATAAAGISGRSRGTGTTNGVPPVGGVGAGAVGVRAGTTARGAPGGRTGSSRLATPQLRKPAEDEAARIAREKSAAAQAEKEAKRAALAEKRAERAARKAERQGEASTERSRDRSRDRSKGKAEEREDREQAEQSDERTRPVDDQVPDQPGDRPAAITVVHYAPGEEPEEPRR